MAIKTIVFDFGNVVSFFDHRLTTNRLAAHAGIPAEALHAFLFGTPLEEEYESGKLTTAEFLSRIRETCKLSCADEVIAEAWADVFHLNEAISGLLPKLKPHHRLLLGSNTNDLHAQQFRRQFAEILEHFDALVLSHEIGVRKPQPGFFEHCQRLAGNTAAESLFIDDLPANVAGARACGWHGIVYTGIAQLHDELAALNVKGLEQGTNFARK